MAFFGSGDGGILVETDPLSLQIANNLSDVASAATARSNLGVPATGAVMLLDGSQAMTGAMDVGNQAVNNVGSLEFDIASEPATSIYPGAGPFSNELFIEGVTEGAAFPNNIFSINLKSADADGTDYTEYKVIGDSASPNTHYATFGYFPTSGGRYVLFSYGTPTPKPIQIGPIQDTAADAVKAADLLLRAADKSAAGTGDGGDITLQPGRGLGSGGDGKVTWDYGINRAPFSVFEARADVAALQGSKASSNFNFALYTKDHDGTDDLNFRVYGSAGTGPESFVDSQYAQLAYSASGKFSLISTKSGSQVPLPFEILITDEATADAAQAPSLTIRASNKTNGTGDGGDVYIQSGSSVGGSGGEIYIQSQDDAYIDADILYLRNESGITQWTMDANGRFKGNRNNSMFSMKHVTSPVSTQAGFMGMYPKNDDRWYQRTSAGTESQLALSSELHDAVTVAAVGSTPNANGVSLTGQQINLQPFDATNPGVVTASGGGTTNFLRADGTWAAAAAAGVTDHGALTGLGDDDHTQYVLADGTRDITGDISIDSADFAFNSAGGLGCLFIGTNPVSGTGNNVTAMGALAGANLTTGFGNTLYGASSGLSLTEGQANAFYGINSGRTITTGDFNAAFGAYALSNAGANTSRVIAVGYNAGVSQTGQRNIWVGYSTGVSTTGSNNITFAGVASGADFRGLTSLSASNELSFGSSIAPLVDSYFGEGAVSASPGSFTINATGGRGTDISAGANFDINGGKGTGTGAGSSIRLRTSPPGSTGSTQNALVTRIEISDSGEIGFFGTTPASQPSTVSDPAGGATIDSEARTAINAIIDALQSLGLMA